MDKKGSMKSGLANLRYSKKALEALAETLKIHRSMVWLDPVSNRVSIKKSNFKTGSHSFSESEGD